MGVLDDLRKFAASVAESARYVHLRRDAVHAYARSLPLERVRTPTLDPATHYLGEPDQTLAFVVTLDAINFGSGYFPRLRKRSGLSGYFTVASGLKEAWPLCVDELAQFTPQKCGRIFQQPMDDPAVAELMCLFARALNDLAACVRRHGSFRELVDAAHSSAERLVTVLAEMPFYRDVPFYKRAQLTAADLTTADVATFDDLNRLTIFADNLVPHVLRVDGVLRYDAELLARINREQLLEPGSREEIEIRACALHAVELIADALHRTVSPMHLDYLLWNRGQQPMYKAQPRHRARTVYY
jgi:Potential Queuosine, Q, salvage protein family